MTSKLKPGLYIVATPIGNLQDITLRAISTLQGADVIYCEDTRTSAVLMHQHAIQAPLKVYNDHSDARARGSILEQLMQGRAVALISDAGTPLISDPGYKLVEAVRAEGHEVISIPGACAGIVALAAAGLPTDEFTFLGFVSTKEKERLAMLSRFAHTQETLVMYERASRLKPLLEACAAVFGRQVKAAIARELTKQFEQIEVHAIDALLQKIGSDILEKGECVVLIGPRAEAGLNDEALDALIQALLPHHPSKTIASLIASMHPGFSKNRIYERVIYLKERHAAQE